MPIQAKFKITAHVANPFKFKGGQTFKLKL